MKYLPLLLVLLLSSCSSEAWQKGSSLTLNYPLGGMNRRLMLPALPPPEI